MRRKCGYCQPGAALAGTGRRGTPPPRRIRAATTPAGRGNIPGMDWTLALAVLSGIGVAAACGLRAFLPLLLLGAAARLGWIQLADGTGWLASTPALFALGTAAVLELLGDKVPAVDHVLDIVGTVLRPAAAWLGAYAVLVNWPSPWGQLLALALGSGALLVHGAKAKVRLGSSVATLGHGNPLLSIAEDLVSVLLLVVALAVPVLVFVAGGFLVWILARRGRRPTAGPA